ncbi:MAG: hypothetical protein JRI36_10660 [Deltaproteobacteria bacterium]|nr:hypothetical protein [Deltaproteobacteria bacterium]
MKGTQARSYIIELDGKTYRFLRNRLEQIDLFKDTPDTSDVWLVSDLENALTRKMTVNAPVRYAEIIARKAMQESGEFDEPVSLITHWKARVDRTTTHILFTALPTRLYTRYHKWARGRDHAVLLFPLFVVLESVLERTAGKKPLAIFFHHDRFVDILIGDKRNIVYANRCAAVDNTQEQSAVLWDMVRADLRKVESENGIRVNRVLTLNWVDTDPVPPWPPEENKTLLSIGERTVFFGTEKRTVSFLEALHMQSALRAHTPASEKFLYGVQQLRPALNFLFLMAVVFFTAGALWTHGHNKKLTRKAAVLKGRLAAMHRQVPLEKIPYQEVMSFVRRLDRYHTQPSFRHVVNDISAAVPPGMSVQVLKADYTDNSVHVEVFGRADSSFGNAYTGFQRLTKTLRHKGYHVDDTRFDTAIRRSEFLVKLTKRFHEN